MTYIVDFSLRVKPVASCVLCGVVLLLSGCGNEKFGDIKTLRLLHLLMSWLCIKTDPKPPSANRLPKPCTNKAIATKPKGSGSSNLAKIIPMVNCRDNETNRLI